QRFATRARRDRRHRRTAGREACTPPPRPQVAGAQEKFPMDSSALESFVSTGRLPVSGKVAAYVTDAYERFHTHVGGEISSVYPALAAVPPNLFGICVAGTSGEIHSAGDAAYGF